MKDKRKVFGLIGLVITVLVIVCAVSFKLYTDRYYREDTKVTQAIATEYQDVVSSYSDDNGMVFLPKDQDYKAVIVFYPGGKVEYTAYSGLLYELAAEGYICLLPRMPENLAFLQVNAVDGIRERHPEETAMVDSLDWYLAGHSLGGVAACAYVQEHLDDFSGVILCASYPSTDLSDTNLRLLSVYGSNDGVLNMSKYKDSKKNWPTDSEEYVIQGGVHAYFGCYGHQHGDGKAKISNEQQIHKTVEIISNWIEK
jgi:hypothetical protein